jgi:Cytochrome c7 and related cytochrome c
MSQIFHHTANTYAKMSLVIVAGLLAFAGWAVDRTSRSDYTTRANQEREQPVPFSHAHHVGGLGFDCRYCHTTVETSGFANIPPTKICMNCHSQIWSMSPTLEPVRASFRENKSISWTRVHDLPDFVYFNHSIHVAKGVGCETCHGRVDQMPLMRQQASLQMEWCLNCHRNTEKYIRPRELVTQMGYEPAGDQEEIGRRLQKEYEIRDVRTLTSCNTCHR